MYFGNSSAVKLFLSIELINKKFSYLKQIDQKSTPILSSFLRRKINSNKNYRIEIINSHFIKTS